jgi:hypothetical protein
MYGDFGDYQPSVHEKQMAMSMLAHTARHDDDAIDALLGIVDDEESGPRATHLIAALLAEFQKGMNDWNADKLAEWFSGEACALAREA